MYTKQNNYIMRRRLLLFLATAIGACQRTHAIIAVNTSLATVPVGYYGGIARRRGGANIAMLAKMRLVMIEKASRARPARPGGPATPPCRVSKGPSVITCCMQPESGPKIRID